MVATCDWFELRFYLCFACQRPRGATKVNPANVGISKSARWADHGPFGPCCTCRMRQPRWGWHSMHVHDDPTTVGLDHFCGFYALDQGVVEHFGIAKSVNHGGVGIRCVRNTCQLRWGWVIRHEIEAIKRPITAILRSFRNRVYVRCCIHSLALDSIDHRQDLHPVGNNLYRTDNQVRCIRDVGQSHRLSRTIFSEAALARYNHFPAAPAKPSARLGHDSRHHSTSGHE